MKDPEDCLKRKNGEIDRRSLGMGRPEKSIDWFLVDKLLEGGCLGTEIASHFDMHPNTFYDKVLERYKLTFTEYSAQKRARGHSILRMQQYLKAIGETKKGDNTLLIWLGKQRLDQKDSPLEFAANGELDKKFDAMMSQIKSLQGSPSLDTPPTSFLSGENADPTESGNSFFTNDTNTCFTSSGGEPTQIS